MVDAEGFGWREGRADERRNGSFWSGADWIICHDGKARRAKPGLRLLVDGFPGRVGLWRLAGNAIVPQIAAEVLAALLDVLDDINNTGDRSLLLSDTSETPIDLFS